MGRARSNDNVVSEYDNNVSSFDFRINSYVDLANGCNSLDVVYAKPAVP